MTNAFLARESEYVAREIGNIIFDANYNPTPISKNIYELVHDFMRTNPSENAKNLPKLLNQVLKNEFNDHAILNRLGHARLKKEDKPGWTLELFKFNVKLFPNDGNLWDSLSEAYIKYNEKEKAIECYKKAIELGYERSMMKL